MPKRDRHLYEFGPFRLDTSERLLLREGVRVPLTEKAFDTLIALVHRGGRLASKEELMAEVWPDAFVEENNLDKSISAIRQALGEKPSAPDYVETVRGRGYRFVAQVREVRGGDAGLAAEGHTGVPGADGRGQEPVPPISHTGARQATEDTFPSVTPLTRGGLFKSLPLILGIALVAVGLSVAAYSWLAGRAKRAETAAAPKSIAVLPIKPLAADHRNESLEMGVADTLIFRLSGIRGLVVRPISAVRKYTDLDQDPLAAGREQQVDAVLDSSIQVMGEKIRVTARLIRVENGSVLWADQSDEQFADLFAVQDAIAGKLAGSLAPKLTGEERQRLTKRYTDNIEAYQLYQWGRFHYTRRTPGGHNYKKAIEYFQQAIDKDPGFALAYVGLADCYAGLGAWQILPPNETFPRARAAAEKALELDDLLAEAHTSIARVKALFRDWPGAEAEYKRAIELNPNYETAHHWYALDLAGAGRLDEAMAEMRRAQDIDPRSLIINTEVGRIFYLSRRYDEAIAQYLKTLEMDPNFAQAHLQLGWAYEKKGMYQEAISEYQKAIALGARPTMVSRIGRAYALSGKRREAQQALDQLKAMSQQSYVPAYDFALIYAGLGEKQQALHWLEKGHQLGASYMVLKVDPTWDGLRSEPRFQELLRLAGFVN